MSEDEHRLVPALQVISAVRLAIIEEQMNQSD